MDKDLNNYNHSVILNDRKNLIINGVKKIDSFDTEEFLVETVMGYLVLKGENLELCKLDNISGSITIKGLVKSFDYLEDFKKKEDSRFINRLFK